MTGAIIQARMGSTRLPQKVIKEIEGKTILEHVIERVKRIKNVDKVILATTSKREDDILEKIGKNLKVSVFRGSENDVLDRFYRAAKLLKVDPIIRITADCPLLDPRVCEKVIDYYLKGDYDYVSNASPPTFPDGLDTEVFSFQALEKSWKEVKLLSEREHVTPYIYRNPQIFKLGNVSSEIDFSHLRLTVDEKADLILIREIYKELYHQNPLFGLEEIIKLFERKPELAKINQKIARNEGYLKSLKKDKDYEKETKT